MKKTIPVIALIFISALAWAIFFFVHIKSHALLRLTHVVLFAPWAYSFLAFLQHSLRLRLSALKQYALLVGIAIFCVPTFIF
jgi:hypothetical protein